MIRIILAVALFYSSSLFAQITVKGKIIDTKNNPLELVEILLIDKDSTAIKSEMTTSNGTFTLEAEAGDYLLKIKQLGTVLWAERIMANQNIDLGAIKIVGREEKLTEVVVKMQKKIIERKLDRLIFNVENSISATGGTAIDALKVTPGLQVENNNISIIGKNTILVMIDERLVQLSGDDLINLLNTIQADNIKNIEVITAPSAKYDAGGNSGIINIKLKKLNKEDLFNANVSSNYEQKTYAAGSVGGNISSQINKLSIYTNLNYKKGSYKLTENRKYYYPSQLWDENNVKREYINILSGRIGLDYKENNKNEFGILYLGSLNKPSNREGDETSIYDSKNQLTNYFTRTESFKNRNEYYHSFNTHYKKNIDSLGKSITANIDYLVTNQKIDRTFEINSFVDEKDAYYNAYTNGNQNVKITTSNVDVELPYSSIKYSLGAKISFITTDNNFRYFDISTDDYVLNKSQSNEFKYTEDTQALYFSTEKKIDKWEFQIGLRAESTQTRGYSKTLSESNKANYFKIYPTIYSSYTADDKNVFALNYSRRVGRPSYYMSNPFRTYINDYSYLEGNPFIQPEFNNNVELSYTYNDNLNTSLSFGYLQDGKSQIQILDPTTNISKSTYLNFFKVYSYSYDISYTLKKWQWLESYNYANLFYRKTIANELLDNQVVEGVSYYITSNNTFILNKPKTFFSSLDLTYRSPQIINIYRIGQTFNINVGFKYLIFDKNLQFTLNFYDVARATKYKSYSYSNGVKSESNNYSDNQFVRFSMLYKFGNKKINVREKRRGNENESNRAN